MKLISWNVNGIRAVLKKGFLHFVKKENPDVICIQETKANKEQVELDLEEYPYKYWSSAHKKGYAGTAIFSKVEPKSVIYGIEIDHHDKEGRVLTLEFDHFYIVNVYAPNAQHGLLRLKYKVEWDNEFLKFIKKLEKKKPVVFCGDMNVAHEEIDIRNPEQNKLNPGFTDEERHEFSKMLANGYIDTFRAIYPKEVKYTWWSYRFNARARNIGWRIDYFCISEKLKNKLKSASILDTVHGSDHCPIEIILD
jgi:exodeoxyribonuclease-3